MSSDPFRERIIAPEEVRRIIKNAADLAAIAPVSSEGLTETQLLDRLTALGISTDVARRAIDGSSLRPPVTADGITRVVREVELEGMVSPEKHEEIADAISQAMRMQGRVSVVGNKLTWTPNDRRTEPSVTIHVKDGRTAIRYVETLANSGQLTFGFGTLAGLAGLLSGALATVALVALCKALDITRAAGATWVVMGSVIVGIVGALTSFVGLRRAFARRARTRAVAADEVIAHVATVTRAAIPAERLRIEESHEHDVARLAAEEDLAAGPGRRVART